MDSCCLHQILTLPSASGSRKQDSSDQVTFFQSSAVQFCWACALCSLSILSLAERCGTQCEFGDALLHSTVVTLGYLSYGHLTVNLNQSDNSPPPPLLTEVSLTGCCLFFTPFSINSGACCARKSQEISSFSDTQTSSSPGLIPTTLTLFLVNKNPFYLHSDTMLKFAFTSRCP